MEAHAGADHRRVTCPVAGDSQRHKTGTRGKPPTAAAMEGECYEANGFRFYLLDDDCIVHLICRRPMGDDEAFDASLRQVKDHGLIPEDQVRLCESPRGTVDLKWVEKL